MSDSPPLTPPQQNEDSETQQNPNSVSDSENPPSETQIDNQIQPEITIDDVDDDDPDPDFEPETEGMMNIAHSTMVVSESKASSNNNNNNRRRVAKRKKGCKNQAVSKKKTQQLLLQGFNPIPFVPGKSLDFSKYEEFLKLLGLWDFGQLQFDTTFRVDLIGELIVNYKKARGSYVNGLKIGVSRADLARALKLPVSKKVDCDVDEFPEAFLCFLEEFVSNLMLLHEEVWCTPKDIVASMKTIRDGHPHKFDWAGLIWYMVEKELSQKQGLKDCYYAPHLQQLIKMQKKELFLEQLDAGVGVGVEVENPKVGEVENSKEAVELDDDDEDGEEVKMEEEVEELGGSGEHRLEEENVELRLGQECDAKVENVVDQVEKNGDECCADEMKKVEDVIKMKEEGNDGWNSESVDEANKGENAEHSEHVADVNNNGEIMRAEESKDVEMMDFGGDYKEEDEEEEGQGQWFLDGKIGGHHFFQRCSSMAEMKVTQDRGLESVGEDHEVEDGLVEGFKILPKNQLDGITSANLMQAFETGQLPYSSTELGGQSSLDLMSSRADDNMMLGGPSMSNQAGKREIDDGHDISHHVLNDNHKRMRVDTSWDDKPPEVSFCLDQILQWAEKAKLRQMSDAEEAFQQTNVTQHIFSQQMAQKESDIVQLRYELDDLQRSKKMELDRLNRELYLMNSVVDGYRKALKQTQKTFAEYRKRCQVSDEPVYKDAGLGGVVKSVTELERERLKQEEENKMMRKYIEDTFREHLNDCEVKWESEVLEKVHSHHSRLMDAVKEMELLKDLSMKRKTLVDVQNVVPQEDPPSE